MDIKVLQRKTITKTAVYAVLLICATAINIYLGGVSESAKDKYNFLKNDIVSLSKKIEGLSAQALEFSESVKTWESFSKDRQNLDGLHISNAKDMIDKLQTEYKISNVKLTFSKPEELTNEFLNTPSVLTISSDVNIDFNAITDEHALNFIGALMNNFPGYVQINSFSLTRAKDINKDIVTELSQGKTPSVIDAKVTLTWRDLKRKETVAEPDKGAQPK
jgi:hypothetical protein